MDDSGYPNRGAAAFSFAAVVFAAAFVPMLLELLLRLVFVEFASERGQGTAGTARRHTTQTRVWMSNEQLAHVVCCFLSNRYTQERAADPDVLRALTLRKGIYSKY